MKTYRDLTERKMKVVDKVYEGLKDIPEFKNKSMDEQGEICVKIAKMLK